MLDGPLLPLREKRSAELTDEGLRYSPNHQPLIRHASHDTFSRPGEGNYLFLNQHTDRIFDQRLEYLDKLGTQSAIHRAVVG